MRSPLYVRPLTGTERDALKAGLRSSDAFTMRRSQILLASARADTRPTVTRSFTACDARTKLSRLYPVPQT